MELVMGSLWFYFEFKVEWNFLMVMLVDVLRMFIWGYRFIDFLLLWRLCEVYKVNKDYEMFLEKVYIWGWSRKVEFWSKMKRNSESR